MAKHYVQVGEDNYIVKNALSLLQEDDPTLWVEVIVETEKEIDFNNQFTKYYVDPVTHAVTKNHNTTTIGDVNKQLSDALDTIQKQNETVNSLKQQLGLAVKAQVEAQKTFNDTNKVFQNQFGQLTFQFVELQKRIQSMSENSNNTTNDGESSEQTTVDTEKPSEVTE